MSHLCATQRFAEPRDYPRREPDEYCGNCGRGIWEADDVIQTATGTLVGNRCCVDSLLDGDCPECRRPVLTDELVEHFVEEHGMDDAAADEKAAHIRGGVIHA